MLIRNTQIPSELVLAHREGRLVFFVGAGASLDSPADLPTFKEMVIRIGNESVLSIPEGQEEHLDRILGDWDVNGIKDKIDVHQRVKDIIGAPSSEPNKLHMAIAKLASSYKKPRVVTTNYDRHLSRDLGEVGEYRAPALPVGDDFTGIVYLHGSVDQESRFLVVTDMDFGRAYLTEAWATRFLERMFREFVVLFIGYSHNDTVMSYLARGLPRTSKRYVLTDDPERSHWHRLGIVPVGYSVGDNGSHDELRYTIERWTYRIRMGFLDHERRVAELVSHPPSKISPEDTSYLEEVVSDPERIQFFTEKARGRDWLDWAVTRPQFQALFRSQKPAGKCEQAFASWFAEHSVATEDLPEHALRVLNSQGGQLSEVLCQAIARQLSRISTPRPTYLDTWITVLLEQVPHQSASCLESILLDCQQPGDRDILLLLLNHLMEPRVEFDQFALGTEPPRLRVTVRGKYRFLSEVMRKLLVPNMADLAADLVSLADHHLRLGYRLTHASGKPDSKQNWLCFSRPKIEPYHQNSNSDGAMVLIDIARDAIVKLTEVDLALSEHYLDTWINSECALLRRLAVHAWNKRTDLSADEKLVWLEALGILYNLELHHEVFQLVGKMLPEASSEVVAMIIDCIKKGPPEPNKNSKYRVYNFVGWLAQEAPTVQEVQEAFEEQKAAHPDIGLRDHPDLLFSHRVGWIGPSFPIEPAELHTEIQSNPVKAIDKLMAYRKEVSSWGEPNLEDALQLLAATVQKWPDDGSVVLNALGTSDNGIEDLISSIVCGWSGAKLSEEAYVNLAEALQNLLPDHDGVIREASQFLFEQANSANSSPAATRSHAARTLAETIWNVGIAAAPAGNELAEAADWPGRAINHWAGFVTWFWISSISSEWHTDLETWERLPKEIRSVLNTIIDGSAQANEHAQAVFIMHLGFLFRADKEWTTESALPLFDWNIDATRAHRCWDIFLEVGIPDYRLPDAGLLEFYNAGLLDFYLETLPHLSKLDKKSRDSFCGHLAMVALQSDIHPLDSGWLSIFTSKVEPEIRVQWIKEISWQLGNLSQEFAETAWARWMHEYWEQRLQSKPAFLTREELSAIAEWPVFLDRSFVEASQLATKKAAGLGEHSNLLTCLLDSDLINKYPDESARWVSHLLKNTNTPFHQCHVLSKLVQALQSTSNDKLIDSIKEEGIRLGCTSSELSNR